ncbi:MAG: hypothetical protein FD170_1775 [Bacteroidetes bacterium]|nr:MAG: hypothetical protein FD170_1775 [Bacteroidota bacterium]
MIQLFNSAEFINYLDGEERLISLLLRDIVIETLPGIKEKMAYNVPFFSMNKRICYIWPSKIPWGGVKKGVHLGFCYGNRIEDKDGLLHAGTRKMIRTLHFNTVEDIEPQIIITFLKKAAEIDRLK